MSLNINPLLVDLQTFLETNSESVKVYREESVPTTADTANGYIAWNVDLDEFEKCSTGYKDIAYGDLEIIVYARTRAVRSTLIESILDLVAPSTLGVRDDFSPTALTSTFIHYCTLIDQDEILVEKTGHGSPDVPGNSFTFSIKASL
jgi:hypothetical protein